MTTKNSKNFQIHNSLRKFLAQDRQPAQKVEERKKFAVIFKIKNRKTVATELSCQTNLRNKTRTIHCLKPCWRNTDSNKPGPIRETRMRMLHVFVLNQTLVNRLCPRHKRKEERLSHSSNAAHHTLLLLS